ncbi:hypothetical protein JCM8208_001066 [Rhodotorula glutinis]
MDFANAGAGFGLAKPPASSTKRTQPTTRSTTAPRKSHHPRQRLLRPLDSIPLVTPRTSSTTAPRPTHTQSKLSLAPPSQRPPLADKRNRRDSPPPSSRDSNPKGKAGALVVPDSDEPPAEPVRKPGWLSSMFGRAPKPRTAVSTSSSSSTPSSTSRSTHLGRAILHPPHPRRGPTIDFDGPDLAADDDELADEDARRKRRRTEDRGGFGKLDLCDEDVHVGFGTQRDADGGERARRTKRSLVMDGVEREVDVKPRTVPGAHLAAPPQHITLASSSSPTASVVAARSIDDDDDDDDSELEPEPSTASSGSSAERDLQAQLVPPAPPHKRAPRVLVPDSDPPSGPDDDDDELPGAVSDDDREEELEALVQRLGGTSKGGTGVPAGVDDSGFAEVSGLDIEPGEDDDAGERDETPSPRDVTGADEVMDLTIVPSSSPLVSNAHELLGPPRPSVRPPLRPDADSSTSTPSTGSGGSSLGRTASGILMPPPALPRKRLRRGAPSTRAAELEAEAEAEARARVLVEDTQVRSPTKVGAPRERPVQRPYMVVCDETQSQLDGDADLEHLHDDPLAFPPIPHYRTLPRLPRPPNLAGSGALSSPAVGGPAAAGGAFLSSDPDHLPPLPTPRPLAVPLSPSPARPTSAIAALPPVVAHEPPHDPAWASLASAWAGARPPSPAPPRQTHLADFFAVVPASQACGTGGDEGDVVEDSQMPAAESALEEALRRQKAVNLAREQGSGRAGPAAAGHEDDVAEEGAAGGLGGEEVLEVEVEVEEEVPDSDPEDDAPALSPSLRRTIPVSTSPASTLADLPSTSSRPLRPTTAPTPSFFRSTPTATTATTAVKGPPSPLGTPIRKRFPRYSPGKMRLAVERWAGAGPARAPVAAARPALPLGAASARDVFSGAPAPAPAHEKRAAEAEGAATAGEGDEQGLSVPTGGAGADETQWESYWSYPTSSGEGAAREAGAQGGAGPVEEPADGLEDDDDEDDEESLALPAGWARSERGDLVRVATPAATARADVSVEVGAFEDETLTGW